MDQNSSVSEAVDLILRGVKLLKDNSGQSTNQQQTSRNAPAASLGSLPGTSLRPQVESAVPDRVPHARSLDTLTERRQQFSPYRVTEGSKRKSSSSGTALKTKKSSLAKESFTVKFCCLPGPSSTVTLSSKDAQKLNNMGIGTTAIQLGKNDTSEEIEEKIRAAFAKLGNCNFIIKTSLSNGAGKRLNPVSFVDEIPNGSMLNQLRSSLFYIQPKSNILQNSTVVAEPEPDNSARQSVETFSRPVASVYESEIQLDPASLPQSPSMPNISIPLGNLSQVSSEDPQDIPLVDLNYGSQLSTPLPNSFGEEVAPKRPDPSLIKELDDFRAMLLSDSSDRQFLLVTRESFEEELPFIYKDPEFSFTKKLLVKFAGELGRDVNALTNEFFTLSSQSIVSMRLFGNYALLEGMEDHLLPNMQPSLIANRMFVFLGQFLGHSIIQTGRAITGLSQSAVQYIFKTTDMDFQVSLKPNDMPTPESQTVVKLMIKGIQAGSLKMEEVTQINEALNMVGIVDKIPESSLFLLMEQYMEFVVYYSRAICYTQIAEGLKTTPLFDFLKNNPSLWSVVFPPISSLLYSAEDVTSKITYYAADYDRIKDILEEFIGSLESHEIKNLVQSWCGSPSIPREGFKVTVAEEMQFCFRACLKELTIPISMSEADVIQHLKWGIENPFGYGSP